MKGQGEVIHIMIELVAIFVGTALFLLLFKTIATTTEISKINVQAVLVSKINEACIKDPGSKVEVDGFSLQQVTPITFAQLVYVLPKFNILGLGDPEFLVYHEAFPYGEGIGWEVYQFQDIYRVYAPYIGDEKINEKDEEISYEDFKNKLWKGEDSFFVNTTKKVLEKRPDLKDKKLSVYITNVMLSEYTDVFPTREAEPLIPVSEERAKREDIFGKWAFPTSNDPSKDVENYNFFKPVISVNREQKAFIKYRPCGVNSLCFKTATVVYRYPLDQSCSKIKNIHLSYSGSKNKIELIKSTVDLREKIFATGILARITFIGGQITQAIKGAIFRLVIPLPIKTASLHYLNIKDSDFYVASPCKINSKITIEKKQCSEIFCDQWIKYPIYAVYMSDKGELRVKNLGDHYQCTSTIRDDQGIAKSEPLDGLCLDVKVEDLVDNYCWTRDPYGSKYSLIGFLSKYLTVQIKKEPEERALISFFGVNPISSSSEYIDEKTILISPKDVSFFGAGGAFIIAEGKKFFDTVWLWPEVSGSKVE